MEALFITLGIAVVLVTSAWFGFNHYRTSESVAESVAVFVMAVGVWGVLIVMFAFATMFYLVIALIALAVVVLR